MYAKVSSGGVLKCPYLFSDLQADNPYTSSPTQTFSRTSLARKPISVVKSWLRWRRRVQRPTTQNTKSRP
jgi:hypothetical protein